MTIHVPNDNGVIARIEEAMYGAHEVAKARGDSVGNLDVASLLWYNFLATEHARRTARGDSVADLDTVLARAGIQSARADASSYYQGEGIERSQREFMQPERPRELLRHIPIRPIDARARSYTDRELEISGQVQRYNDGDTIHARVGISRTETAPRGVHTWMTTFNAGSWLQGLFMAHAGRSDGARLAAGATRLLESALNLMILQSEAGTDLRGIKQDGTAAIPILRNKSTVTVGDYTSGNIDAVFEDLRAQLQKPAEVSDGSMPGHDTAIVSRRWYNKLTNPSNFEVGGSDNADAIVEKTLRSQGIQSLVLAAEMQDIGGTGVDGVLTFNSTDEGGLRHALAMRPAPIGSETHPVNGTTTYVACRSGGLSCVKSGAAHLILYPVQ